MSHLKRRAKHGCSVGAGGGSEWGLNENESEVKVVGVGAAADHPGGTLEQDARLDGERSSNHYRRRDKEREGGREGWMEGAV